MDIRLLIFSGTYIIKGLSLCYKKSYVLSMEKRTISLKSAYALYSDFSFGFDYYRYRSTTNTKCLGAETGGLYN